jgi:membrane fusion protein, copper/silver efflux system
MGQSESGHGSQLREVMPGPSLGDSTIVRSGLQAGEAVVVNGAFSIDAAAQLEGLPSMMDPQGGPGMEVHAH